MQPFFRKPQPHSPADTLRLSLAEKVRSLVLTKGETDERIPGLHLSYLERSSVQSNCFYVLSIGIILQGKKRLNIGNKTYEYGDGAMLLTSIDMPTSYELLEVSPSKPFVSFSLRLNPAILTEILSEEPTEKTEPEVFRVEQATQELLEDFDRLLRLLDHPSQIEARAPLLIRDIHYLALSSAAGECLRSIYAPNSTGQKIKKVVKWLRENFREAISIDQLSQVAGMSPSTLSRHFKAFTSLSPLQYQKRLRLYEAQQFLLKGEGDVNSAAYAVGYLSPQQFNRDYRRFFGVSPGKSTKTIRQEIYQNAQE